MLSFKSVKLTNKSEYRIEKVTAKPKNPNAPMKLINLREKGMFLDLIRCKKFFFTTLVELFSELDDIDSTIFIFFWFCKVTLSSFSFFLTLPLTITYKRKIKSLIKKTIVINILFLFRFALVIHFNWLIILWFYVILKDLWLIRLGVMESVHLNYD